ncbi:hypothetical protein M885DRAFT_533456 [Pelagophyceae sp. CCMP2097]|nr:hypothetical protein M885DRAFT_533456 [Pelagophyceae sp. CCMP2097]
MRFLALFALLSLCTARLAPRNLPPPWLQKYEGRKFVEAWSGDVVDASKSGALGFATGAACKIGLRVASGVVFNVVFTAAAAAAAAMSGVITVNWDRLQNMASTVVPVWSNASKSRFFRGIDVDGDGSLTRDDARRVKQELARRFNTNEHAAVGGLAGFFLAFILL